MAQSKKFTFSCIALVSVLILTRIITISPTLLSSLTSLCTYPIVVWQHCVVRPIQQIVVGRKSHDELVGLVAAYQQQVSQLLAENIQQAATLAHMQHVDEMVSFVKRYKTDQTMVAQVMLKHISPEGHFFLIDAGARRGIVQDMIAVHKNCLIGRVTEVYPHYSKVMLITDRLSKVPIVCLATHTQGIHEGSNDITQSKLEFISHLNPLQKDDLVMSSGDGLIYPKGFGVGKIKDFSLNGLGLTYVVSVEPLVKMDDIEYVCLIQKGAEYEPSHDELFQQNSAPELPVQQTQVNEVLPDNSSSSSLHNEHN